MYDVVWDARDGRYAVRHTNLRSDDSLRWSARVQEDERAFARQSSRYDRRNATPVIMAADVVSYAVAVQVAEHGPWPRGGPY